MSLAEVVPMVQTLPREEKRQLLKLLSRDLADSEGHELLASLANTRHEFWSPFEASEAAQKMEELLRSPGLRTEA